MTWKSNTPMTSFKQEYMTTADTNVGDMMYGDGEFKHVVNPEYNHMVPSTPVPNHWEPPMHWDKSPRVVPYEISRAPYKYSGKFRDGHITDEELKMAKDFLRNADDVTLDIKLPLKVGYIRRILRTLKLGKFDCQICMGRYKKRQRHFTCNSCGRYICTSCYEEMKMVDMNECSYCGGKVHE